MMLTCMGLRGYVAEIPGFLGCKNAMFERREYFCLPMTMQAQPCFPPPKSDSKYLTLAMNSLCITMRYMKVGLHWFCVRLLCVNYSQILLTAGSNTNTMMDSFPFKN